MKKKLLTLCLGMFTLFTATAQTPWDQVPEFGYTNETNPVQPGGNNMLQGAEFASFIMNDSWAPLDASLQATYDGTSFSTGTIHYKAPEGRGTKQWTGQMYLQTDYKMEKGKKYDLSFRILSTAANNFTVKVESKASGDVNLTDYYVTLPANKEVIFALKDAVPEQDIPEVKLIFDVGGAEIGSEITISDIILQSADALSGSNTPLHLDKAPEGYELVWFDEFDDPATLKKDSKDRKWEGMDWAAGNVNHELQTYKKPGDFFTTKDGGTQTPAEIKDGKLIIHCFKGQDGKIYSGRLDSHAEGGNHSGYAAWRYGYMEARIKLPSGKGTWPAYWMMPEGVNWSDETWPTCGEIDIMEEVGNDPNVCVSSLHAIGHYHANNTQVSGRKPIDNMEGGWVTYALLWDNNSMAMYANGQRILTYDNDHDGYVNWPYDRPYYITLNLAWGGDWGGAQGVDESKLPLDMEVDYVRVYQLPNPDMNEDGSGHVYLQGPFNGVAKDGFVPSSTFSNWNDNFIDLEDNNKVYSQTFVVGKNLHKTRGGFMFFPNTRSENGFGPKGTTYKATIEANDYLDMNDDGWMTLKNSVLDGTTFTVVLDCSNGTDNTVVRVENVTEPEPAGKPEGIWIIGADQSVVPGMIDGGSYNWQESKAIKMTEKDDIYTYEFELGKTLSRKNINFKFFCQAGFTNADGKEVAFVANGGDYQISSESEYIGIGDGTGGHDNGNAYKLKDFPADMNFVDVIVDCTKGYNNAVLKTNFKTASGIDEVTMSASNDDCWYDVAGRKIGSPKVPGLYLHGKKKLIVK